MIITERIKKNRQIFLSELRSGRYKKGCIKSDEKGKPIIASIQDDDGMCACAIMIHLFPKEGKPNFPFAKDSLGIKSPDCRYIQQDLNDTDLTFPQIADRIEREIFWLKIVASTPFKKIQQYYPDAIKGIFTTNKPMEYIQQGLFNTYNQVNKPLESTRCLFRSITPIKRRGKITGYKNVFIFSEQAATCNNCKEKNGLLFKEGNTICDRCLAELYDDEK